MSQPQHGTVIGRTRWRRFGIAMVPSTLAAGAIIFAVASGALAATFTVSGQAFKVSADTLHGEGFRQFGDFDRTADGTLIPVARTVIDDATIKNLCQSVNVPNPLGIRIVLRIEAGTGDQEVTADNLSIGVSSLTGNATFTNIEIGRDAGELGGVTGSFGQSADTVDITDLQQQAFDTSAGTFVLNGLNLRVLTGANAEECF